MWADIKKLGIRCKGIYRGEPCNRRLFDGSPGFDVFSDNPKEQCIICPRCGATNLVSVKIFEEVIVKLVRLKELKKI